MERWGSPSPLPILRRRPETVREKLPTCRGLIRIPNHRLRAALHALWRIEEGPSRSRASLRRIPEAPGSPSAPAEAAVSPASLSGQLRGRAGPHAPRLPGGSAPVACLGEDRSTWKGHAAAALNGGRRPPLRRPLLAPHRTVLRRRGPSARAVTTITYGHGDLTVLTDARGNTCLRWSEMPSSTSRRCSPRRSLRRERAFKIVARNQLRSSGM
jgi:hypothetical protein